MQFQYTPYIFPLLISAVVSGWMAVYVWQRRQTTRGAVVLALLAAAIAEWSVGYALEIAGADLPTKIFWGKSQYLGIVAAPLFWAIFAYLHSNQGNWLTRRKLVLLSSIPALTLILVLTTEWHGLVWQSVRIDTTSNFPALDITHGAWFWVHSVYSYILLLAGTILLLRSIGRMQGQYRYQVIALLIAVLSPWVANVIFLLGLSPISNLDLTPFAFTISVVALTWGIIGFQLIDISPVARGLVVDDMTDGVIVLDVQGRIADINPAAQRAISLPASQAIGQRAQDVLKPWSALITQYENTLEAQDEVHLGQGESQVWYELHLSPLYDSRKHLLGRVVTVRNITERKRVETLLRESETRYRQFIENASDIIYRTDLTGHFIFCNPIALHRMGYATEAGVLGKHYLELASPDWHHRMRRFYERQLVSGELNTYFEFPAIAADGHEVWLGQNVQLVRDGERTIGFQAVARDITERKLAEAQVQQLSSAVEASPASIVITNTKGDIEYVNPKFTEVTGYSAQEALGQNPRILKSNLTPPEVYTQLWQTLLAKHEWSGELCNRKKNGELFWEIASISPIVDSLGNTTHYVAVKEDITARKRIEDALQTTYRQQQSLSSLLRLGLESAPLDELLAKALREILSISWMSIEPGMGGIFLIEDQPNKLMLKAQQNLPPVLQSMCAQVAFGHCLCGRAAATRQIQFADCVDERHENTYEGIIDHGHYNIPILEGDKVLGVIVLYLSVGHQKADGEERFLRDIADVMAGIIERKQAEQQLAIARDQALAASRAKSQLLAKVSHELRTPLGGVLGYAELLNSNAFGVLEEKQTQATSYIIDSAQYLTAMVNELLDEAQIESGSVKLNVRRFAPRELLSGIEQSLGVLARNKGLTLTAGVAPNLSESLYGDENRLRQILINLTGNAVKFTETGWVRIGFSQVDSAHWSLQVSDSGVGIPKEAQAYIFEPFRQLDNSITRNNRGTGLGLSITKSLVEIMGGQISVNSEIGQGSTFTVVLPILEVEEHIA